MRGMKTESFWKCFLSSQQIQVDREWRRHHPFRTFLSQLLHPIRYWQLRRARTEEYREARRQAEQSVQQVINDAIEKFDRALQFLKRLDETSQSLPGKLNE